MPLDIDKVVEDLGRGFEQLTARMEEIGKKADTFAAADPVDKEVVDNMAEAIADMKANSEAIERKLNAASLPNLRTEDDAKRDQEKKDFLGAIRRKASFEALQSKSVDADFANDSTSGGVAIPEVIASEILKKVLVLSPMRSLVRVTQVSSPNYQRLVDSRGMASGWAAETDTRSVTDTPVINKVTFTHGELYAVPKASNWSLNDLMYNVEQWLVDGVADEFAYQEGAAILTGNGTNKPTGIISGSPSATDDEASPARTFGTLQYVPTGKAGAFQNDLLTSPAGDPLAVFIDTVAALKTVYRAGARWLMNRGTFAVLLKMRDADGRPIIHWDASGGVPMNILGYPITIMDGMPDVGSNAYPVAFGDFRSGYELLDITGMSMIRDDVTVKGFTLFYVARRLGGKLTDDDAIKLIKAAAS